MDELKANEIGRVETVSVEGALRIRLVGECDIYTASNIQEHLQSLLDRGLTRIIFDLEHVRFLDSSVLRIFLDARQSLRPSSGEVVLLCRPGFVRRLLTLLELDKVLRICTPEEWRAQVAAVH
ncbi:MAG: anti-anti-sigma factor [Armatimonadetes bacterium]|jgi:anti-anti-sigma factor|nr:anti-anti-sigma factor [Armatimonadota bacterium]